MAWRSRHTPESAAASNCMKFFLGVAELTCLAHLYSTRQPPLTDPGLVRVEHKRGRPIVKKGVDKRNVKIDFLKTSSTLKSLSQPRIAPCKLQPPPVQLCRRAGLGVLELEPGWW
jgi:hypothetical protein